MLGGDEKTICDKEGKGDHDIGCGVVVYLNTSMALTERTGKRTLMDVLV
jgi:hypothetical protein